MELACVPGLFTEESVAKFHPHLGNGILIPSICAERIIEETATELLSVFSMILNGETHYMTLAGYSPDEYAYIPGDLLGADFYPGELMTLDIVKNVGHAGVLILDCEWFDNAKEILERYLSAIYRVVYPGMIIKTDDGTEYRVKAVQNMRGDEIEVGLAIDADIEIIFNDPELATPVVPEEDLVTDLDEHNDYDDYQSHNSEAHAAHPLNPSSSAEEPKPTLAELRAMRLAYFDKGH